MTKNVLNIWDHYIECIYEKNVEEGARRVGIIKTF